MSKQTHFDRSLEGTIKRMDDNTLINEIHRMQDHLQECFTMYDKFLEIYKNITNYDDIINYYKSLTNEYIERTTDHGKQGKN